MIDYIIVPRTQTELSEGLWVRLQICGVAMLSQQPANTIFRLIQIPLLAIFSCIKPETLPNWCAGVLSAYMQANEPVVTSQISTHLASAVVTSAYSFQNKTQDAETAVRYCVKYCT